MILFKSQIFTRACVKWEEKKDDFIGDGIINAMNFHMPINKRKIFFVVYWAATKSPKLLGMILFGIHDTPLGQLQCMQKRTEGREKHGEKLIFFSNVPQVWISLGRSRVFFVTKDWPVILELPAQSHKHKRYSKKARGPPPANPYRLSLLEEDKNTLVTYGVV